MTRVTATNFSNGGRTQKPKTLKDHMSGHKKLEIGQILTQNTNGYRKHSVTPEVVTIHTETAKPEQTKVDAPKQEITAQQALTPKPEQEKAQIPAAEQPKAEQAKQEVSSTKTEQPKVEPAKQEVTAQKSEIPKMEQNKPQTEQAAIQEKRPKSTSIAGRRHYEKKIGIYKDKRPKNLAELRKQRKKLEVGQTLKEDTNGYKNKTKVTTPAATAVETQSSAPKEHIDKPEVKQTTNSAALNSDKQSVTQKQNIATETKGTITTKQTKPSIVLNERGTYDVKLAGEPTRTFSTQADAQKFLDNFTGKSKAPKSAAQIVLNERGTYDVKLAGEPTRTFSTQADAQKFLNNFTGKSQNAAGQTLKFMPDGTVEYNGNKYTNFEQCQKAHPEVKLSTQPQKGNLTPIEAGKAPFNKKFWGNAEALGKDVKLNYTPEVKTFQLGANSKAGLTPIQAGKAPFNKKFWGNADALGKDAKLNYTPEVKTFQLGANNKAELTPIQAGKAPFNKKFWGNAEALGKDVKLNYAPNPSGVKLGAKAGQAAGTQTGKFSIKQIKQVFNTTNIKNVFKSRGGKFGLIAAGVAAVGAGIAAVASANSGEKGFTTAYIKAPEGYVDLLKNYEQTHGTDVSYKTLEEAIK